MKIINLIGITATLLMLPFIVACSSDDDDDKKGNGGANDIVGNWFYYDKYEPEFYSFKRNGNFVFEICALSNRYDSESWAEEPGTYKADDGELVLRFSDSEKAYYEYKVKGDVLTLIDEDGDKILYERTECESLEECIEEYGL